MMHNDKDGARTLPVSITALITGVIVIVVLVFLIAYSLHVPRQAIRFPLELKQTLADAPAHFIPSPLRTATVDLDMFLEEVKWLVTSPQHAFRLSWPTTGHPSFDIPPPNLRFDRFYLHSAGPMGDLPFGEHRVTGFSCFRDPVSVGYEAELEEVLQDCLSAFGEPHKRLVSESTDVDNTGHGRGFHLLWSFDPVEVWLEFTPTDLQPVERKDDGGGITVLMPPNSYILRFMSGADAKAMRARSQRIYHTPDAEEAMQDFRIVNEVISDAP